MSRHAYGTSRLDAAQREPALTGSVLYDEPPFAELEFDASGFGSANSLSATSTVSSRSSPVYQPISPRPLDPIRQVFFDMRRLASGDPFGRNNAQLFYRQALFMEGFSDDYDEFEPFTMYFPCYQRMGYEQLRTYFTWRTQVRRGEIWPASLSYVFLHIYELLMNIGVTDPTEGLDRLMALWSAYRTIDLTLDKYLPQWLCDYHIYYDLPQGFEDFIATNNLRNFYPKAFLARSIDGDSLALWNSISSYAITKSQFYTAGNEELLKDCFQVVLSAVQERLASQGSSLGQVLFYGFGGEAAWRPFPSAVFYSWRKQADRQVELPGGDIYRCRDNSWTQEATFLAAESGEFAGYLLKKTEACLRQVVKYKFKLTPRTDLMLAKKLQRMTLSFEQLDQTIEKAVVGFYEELNRTIVEVDHGSLARIRKEALGTQQALIVPDDEMAPVEPAALPDAPGNASGVQGADEPDGFLGPPPAAPDNWSRLWSALSRMETQALAIALNESTGSEPSSGTPIKQFARDNNIMLEVLADAINEKAVDFIGDSIVELADSLILYDEYQTEVASLLAR